MENKNDFFLHLPSNVESDYTKENKTNHYFVTLPRPLELNPEEWLVALHEVVYPHMWNNITKPGNKIAMKITKKYRDEPISKYTFIEPAYFASGHELAKAITTQIELRGGKTTFAYNSSTNKMQIKLPDNEEITLSKKLARQMGWFVETKFPTDKGREEKEQRRAARSIIEERLGPETENVDNETRLLNQKQKVLTEKNVL